MKKFMLVLMLYGLDLKPFTFNWPIQSPELTHYKMAQKLYRPNTLQKHSFVWLEACFMPLVKPDSKIPKWTVNFALFNLVKKKITKT